MDPRVKDITGMTFGRWTVLSYVGGRPTYWLCQCACGTVRKITGTSLRFGRSESCGCLRSENQTVHGKHGTSEYRIWASMIQRCHNAKAGGYEHYGGRGITVCERWRKSFVNFLSDMGPRPGKGYSIDRINNSGNYEPDNCEWATAKQQGRNSRHTRFLTLNGETMTISEWSVRTGLPMGTLGNRLRRTNGNVAAALTTPRQQGVRLPKTVS